MVRMVQHGQPMTQLIAFDLARQETFDRVPSARVGSSLTSQTQLGLMPHSADKSVLKRGLAQGGRQPGVRVRRVRWDRIPRNLPC